MSPQPQQRLIVRRVEEKFKVSPSRISGNRRWESQEAELKSWHTGLEAMPGPCTEASNHGAMLLKDAVFLVTKRMLIRKAKEVSLELCALAPPNLEAWWSGFPRCRNISAQHVTSYCRGMDEVVSDSDCGPDSGSESGSNIDMDDAKSPLAQTMSMPMRIPAGIGHWTELPKRGYQRAIPVVKFDCSIPSIQCFNPRNHPKIQSLLN
jgi:hypothetical protein